MQVCLSTLLWIERRQIEGNGERKTLNRGSPNRNLFNLKCLEGG